MSVKLVFRKEVQFNGLSVLLILSLDFDEPYAAILPRSLSQLDGVPFVLGPVEAVSRFLFERCEVHELHVNPSASSQRQANDINLTPRPLSI